jgi:hypothetical protein
MCYDDIAVRYLRHLWVFEQAQQAKKALTIGLRRFDACRAAGRCRKFAGQTGEACGFTRNNRDVLD